MSVFGNGKKTVQDLEIQKLRNELGEFQATVFQGDARLGLYGPAIAMRLSPGAVIDDPVVDGQLSITKVSVPAADGSDSTTGLDDLYTIGINNWPNKASLTLTAIKFPNVNTDTWRFLPGLGTDITDECFEQLEAWVQVATTGEGIDYGRHRRWAKDLASLLPAAPKA